MSILFTYNWSTYGHSMRVSIGVGPVMVAADVWVDSWTKAEASQQAEPKAIACSVDLDDPWVVWLGLTEQMEIEPKFQKV